MLLLLTISFLNLTFILMLMHFIVKLVLELIRKNENVITKAFKTSLTIFLILLLLLTLKFLTTRKVKHNEPSKPQKQYVQMYTRNT